MEKDTPFTVGPAEKDSFDVTGISRSGRVRKKSYKLIDFEPEHNKSKKALKGGVKVGRGRPRKNPLPTKDEKSDDEDDDDMDMFMSTETDDVEGNEDYSESSDEGSDDYENSNDSNVVYGKSFRKDKGKSRCTAYMLWSNEARKKIASSDPNLDFPSISRKMGDMWSNVPKHEKNLWRRKAQNLGVKQKRTILKEVLNPSPASFKPHSTNTHFLNRPLKLRPKSGTTVQTSSTSLLKVNDTTNIAAHFRLLGENLAIIGERLKEHEGQIAISGGLSVLLDSLLCSIGPLLCLTTQLPAVNKNNLEANLGSILDNITYVMPGL
ncbi:HMGXB4 family protein [Megaselia abdita]